MSADPPALLFADERGNIIDHPELQAAGAAAGRPHRVQAEQWLPLPPGSELFQLPGRLPVGYDPAAERFVTLSEDPYTGSKRIAAVAAFLAPAHTQIYCAAYDTQRGARRLPLFAYTAAGWAGDGFVAAALRVDPDPRQDAGRFDTGRIRAAANRRMKELRGNRLVQHLGRCALGYGCPAAKNYFLGRWEAPLPTSPGCNAGCLGCISHQEGSGICSTQERITFVPTAEEIAEIAIPHLKGASSAVASFGQGCEGEPLLQAEVITEAIRLTRAVTGRGTINMNTNASLPEALAALREAGLDSIRVSLNSCRPEYYHRYYAPRGYGFSEVVESIRVMKAMGGFVSLNAFVLPGFTDQQAEVDALSRLVEETGLDMIQLRNLNIDPEWYLSHLRFQQGDEGIGILNALQLLRGRFPALRFGYFNPCLDPAA